MLCAEASKVQLPSGMDYDLRGRIEFFANGNCSPDVFIQELAKQCADAPDFIWDVLALVDQYHRRGRISAQFRRSVREMIERPALTHQRSPLQVPDPAPPAIVSAALVAAPSRPRADEKPIPEPVPALPKPEETTSTPSAQSSAPNWAADGQIIVPVLREYRRPDPESKAPALVRSEPIAALTAENSKRIVPAEWRAPVTASTTQSMDPITVLERSRSGAGRTLQVAALALVVSCVAASTALSDLTTPGSPAALPTQPAPPIQPVTISLSNDRYIAYPGSRSVVIEVNRTGDTSKAVRFVWWTRSSGAKSGQDYIGSRPRTEHLAAGATSAQWTIPILPNSARRHTELFYVFLGSAGDADTGATTQATVFVMGTG